ncbi:MAG: hypothetical protein L6R48_11795 [Planctomycetes bacterium]|nr:hypothetical protein [Planctomycetota bacterium]
MIAHPLPAAHRPLLLLLALVLLSPSLWAQDEDGSGSTWRRLKQIRDTQRANMEAVVSEESLGAKSGNTHRDSFGGRDLLVYLPSTMPAEGKRSLLVALHGGGGNAEFMRDHLKMNGVAERAGFIVAYLNGTAAARIGGDRLKAWNAGGGCCGRPFTEKVDDLGYIAGAVAYLQARHGIAPGRTVGVGHSNGAIMMQTLVWETDLFQTVASVAGTLMSEAPPCAAVRTHTIHNYHGSEDANLPVAGGFGSKGVTTIDFAAQSAAKKRFEGAGGRYLLHLVPGADHSLEHLSQALQQQDGTTLAERIARDLGLAPAP